MHKSGIKGIIPGLLLMSVLLSAGLSSCVVDGDDWWGGPPAGWDTFNDSRLAGYWGLVQYNSDPVGAGDANYLYFNGNGRGYYYYLQGGREYTERTVYYSQDSNTGTSNYQINIQYEYSSPVTMNYWFTHGGNTMWMQWRTGNGAVQTYVYDRMDRAPW